MKKNSRKPRYYKSKIIDDLLSEITPEEQKLMDRKMMLAARIDEAMKAKGMRNVDLAKALNVQPSVVTKWLSGTHNFTAETLWRIGDVLGIKFIDLENEKSVVVYRTHMEVSLNLAEEEIEDYTKKSLRTLGKKMDILLTSNNN